MRNGLYHQIQCRVCYGEVVNIGLCSHANEVLILEHKVSILENVRNAYAIGLNSTAEFGILGLDLLTKSNSDESEHWNSSLNNQGKCFLVVQKNC